MKKLFTLSMLFVATALFAQEETEKKLTLSGSVDAYYQTYLTAPDNVEQSFGTSFADQTGFSLGMANIIVSYEGEKTGAVADLAFGSRGIGAVGGDYDISPFNDVIPGDREFYVNQLYAYWNVSESTTLTLGRFNTFLGYEVISPVANFNYSTSYLFSNGPFSHVGLKADFALSDDFSLMLAVMNPTDVNNNLTGGYAFGAQLGYAGQFLNLYYDDEEVLGFEIDYTGGFDLTDSFFLGINGAYQTSNDAGFYGAALYPQLAASDAFSVGLRGEYFSLHAKNVDDLPSVLALTLTGSYAVENLTIKPEVRLDSWSNSMPYIKDSQGTLSDNLAAFTLAAIYSF
ncbi:outer membrane beta-barrel protein [Tamlana sp. 2201CG12-4]|uniref:outer membrane beta-barrel protein n=1 Tax=Tamlana sp. 2201CG12-4 TaxID=3112582 RepID=UPI002DBD63F9|nr:outer membrane beta-barrel protein [Tamlana sp. 2201CG12-4]MEC3906505.1 outer membrane beta-barrel protein [Tamlana sp. 2201CG12-4]